MSRKVGIFLLLLFYFAFHENIYKQKEKASW
jgi:hypothetical protein